MMESHLKCMEFLNSGSFLGHVCLSSHAPMGLTPIS